MKFPTSKLVATLTVSIYVHKNPQGVACKTLEVTGTTGSKTNLEYNELISSVAGYLERQVEMSL